MSVEHNPVSHTGNTDIVPTTAAPSGGGGHGAVKGQLFNMENVQMTPRLSAASLSTANNRQQLFLINSRV